MLELDVESVRTRPQSVAFGEVSVTCFFDCFTDSESLEVRYTVEPPFLFDNNRRLIRVEHRAKSADDFETYRDDLTIRPGATATGDEEVIILSLQVSELPAGDSMPGGCRIAILGNVVRAIREDEGISRRELADRTGLSISTIGRLERHESGGSRSTMELLEPHMETG